MIGHHQAVVLGTCQVVKVIARLAELGSQERLRLPSQVEPGIYAELVHPRRRHWPDAMKFGYGQLRYEIWPHTWGDDEQPVGLAVVGRQLCKEFVVGNPG